MPKKQATKGHRDYFNNIGKKGVDINIKFWYNYV